MKHFISILFTATSFLCNAQNTAAIKIYHNTDIFDVAYSNTRAGTVSEQRTTRYNRVSVAAFLQKPSGTGHELVLFVPQFSSPLQRIQYPMNYRFREDASYDSKATSFSFRYEFSKRITSSRSRMGVTMGLALNPYYVHVEYLPTSSDAYYWSTKLFGSALNFIPRLHYQITDRLQVDASIPIKLYDFRAQKERVHNPAIPIRQQQFLSLKSIFFEDAYTLRVGLAYMTKKTAPRKAKH